MHRVGAGGKLFLPQFVVYKNVYQNNKLNWRNQMKFNKWTLGLAAVGLVSWNSAAVAQDTAAPATVLTSLSSTTLSGYVDTSAQWNLGTGNANTPFYTFGGPSKADGFNLNVVQLSLDKPLDESEWAAGYHVDLWLGPDANTLGTASINSFGGGDFAIRQAYISLRTPVGNGLDWKIGVFDTVIGYESLASVNNPNYTHSYGFTIEPTTHTGILGTYKVSDAVSISAGIANTVGPTINEKAHGPNFSGSTVAESSKTYMGAVALTAPTSWGWIGGSTFSFGVVNGFNDGAAEFGGANQANVYAGLTMNTPVTALKLGASMDFVQVHDAKNVFANPNQDDIDFTGDGTIWDGALYATFQATEKLSFSARGEFLDDSADLVVDTSEFGKARAKIWSGTATAQYDLWKNVITRAEFRWDHGDNGKYFGGQFAGEPDRRNAFLLAAQVIYKF